MLIREVDFFYGAFQALKNITIALHEKEHSATMSADAMMVNLVSMNAGDTRAVAQWLVDGARSAAQPQQVMAQLCNRLQRVFGLKNRAATKLRNTHSDRHYAVPRSAMSADTMMISWSR